MVKSKDSAEQDLKTIEKFNQEQDISSVKPLNLDKPDKVYNQPVKKSLVQKRYQAEWLTTMEADLGNASQQSYEQGQQASSYHSLKSLLEKVTTLELDEYKTLKALEKHIYNDLYARNYEQEGFRSPQAADDLYYQSELLLIDTPRYVSTQLQSKKGFFLLYQ